MTTKRKLRIQELLLLLVFLAPFTISLKLSIANICLLPAIALFLIFQRNELIKTLAERKSFYLPIGAFLCIALYSSLFAIDVFNSLRHVGKMAYVLFLIPLYAGFRQHGHGKKILLLMVLGLTVAATHTVFDGAYPGRLFAYAHGSVSEAGQLAIGIFCVIALLFSSEHLQQRPVTSDLLRQSLLPFMGFLILGFASRLPITPLTKHILAGVCAIFLTVQLGKLWRYFRSEEREKVVYEFLITIGIPLIAAALFINLKRGPWVGVMSGLTLLLLVRKPSLLLIGVPVVLFGTVAIEPIRDRLFDSFEHFLMVGGRWEIWMLGGELLARYPLGIGLENALVIKDFSYDIPSNLNHFHSNLINIAVELGWLGLAAYLWWMISVIGRPFFPLGGKGTQEQTATLCLACGILSWQVAGLFEYNFGDSEVFLLALIVMGLIAGGAPAQTSTEEATH